MAKKNNKAVKRVDKKVIAGVIILIMIIVSIIFLFKMNQIPSNIPDTCLAQIVNKECKTKGYTHSNVVRYDVEINKLLFTCLIEKEQPLIDAFVIEVTKEKLNICDLD